MPLLLDWRVRFGCAWWLAMGAMVTGLACQDEADGLLRLAPPAAEKASVSDKRVLAKFHRDAGEEVTRQAIERAGLRVAKVFPHVGITLLEKTEGAKGDVWNAMATLERSGLVEYAEPDRTWRALVVPRDPDFSDLWGLQNTGQTAGKPGADIGATAAWDITTGSSEIVVAVIDTGVDFRHEDLAANMWVNSGEIPGNRVDDDNNGYVDDVHGIDVANHDGSPLDDYGHGTHCAGTIGAVGDNRIGVTGINWHVRLMALKFITASGSGESSGAIECLEYALKMKKEHGVNLKVTSNSWGGSDFDRPLYDAIAALSAEDVLFVAAAGNSNDNIDRIPMYPAAYDLGHVISVAATDHQDLRAYFSNYGKSAVDLAAPGVSILSTIPDSMYGFEDGTSMACPHVAGAAALAWSRFPSAHWYNIKSLLLATVDPVNTMAGLSVTGGRLDVHAALTCRPELTMRVLNPSATFVTCEREIPLVAQLYSCGDVITGARVTVTETGSGGVATLRDNGVAPDAMAGDGTYTGAYRVPAAGSLAFEVRAEVGAAVRTQTLRGTVAVFDYQLSPVDSEWIDATAGTALALSGDDEVESVPLGFDFQYDGASYSSAYVSTNGLLSFSENAAAAFDNLPIPSAANPDNMLAVFWADLYLSAPARVYRLLEGVAPRRRVTIQWTGAISFLSDPWGLEREATADREDGGTFQVTLYEGSSEAVFRYRDVQFENSLHDFGGMATIGAENSTGYCGVQYSHHQAVIQPGTALLLSHP